MTQSKKSLHVFGPKTRRFQILSEKPRYDLLLASDSAFFQGLLSKRLAHRYKVSIAETGEQTLGIALDTPPDVILLSGKLPDMTGLEVLNVLRAQILTKYLPVIFLSSASSLDSIREGLEAGADDYLTKPFDVGMLQARIENQLRIRSFRDELERSNKHLRELGRLKDELLALCSHDLKVPLQTILWHSQMLRDALLDEGGKQNAFRAIEEHGQRLMTYIDDVLELARLGSGVELSERRLDLLTILEEARRLVAGPAAAKNIRLEMILPQAFQPELRGEESLLVRMFQNLLSNAIDRSPRSSAVQISAGQNKDVIWVTIRDQGPPIPPEDITEFFMAYSQKRKAQPQGTGIGLAMSVEIVEKHYGTLDIRPDEDGNCFDIKLPELTS